MEPVTIAFAVAAAIATFVIAAGVVGREAHRLDAVAPRAVYEIGQAVEFVSDRVPTATQARLTPGDVERLLALHLRWLHAKGLQPTNVVDRRQDIVEATVISDETLIGYLLGEAEREGVELLDDVDAVAVVDAHLEYFSAIGAVGPTADDPDVRPDR
ncbi:MAG: hypothetical protein M3487_07595 [Actinomycetota bacterium]|nr:hypothetical protein [Actinomycetota bacterium]